MSMVTEVISLALFIPLVTTLLIRNSENDPQEYFSRFYDVLPSNLFDAEWSTLVIIITIVILLRTIISAGYEIYANRLRFEYLTNLRFSLFTGVMNSRWSHVRKIPTSQLTFSTAALVDEVAEGFTSFLKILESTLLAFAGLFIASAISLQLTVFVFGMALLGVLPLMWFDRAAMRLQRFSIDKMNSIYKQLESSFLGLKTIHSFSASHNVANFFRHLANDYSQAAKNVVVNHILAKSANRLIYGFFLICFVVYASYATNSAVAPIAIIVIISRILPQIQSVHSSVRDFLSKTIDFKAYQTLVDELDANKRVIGEANSNTSSGGGISFQNAGYSYSDETSDLVWHGFTGEIRMGDRIGVLGPSGAGKSTFADIISGLISPTVGQKNLLDSDLVPSQKNNLKIAYLTQEEFVFNTSILENFKIVNGDITVAEVQKLLKLTGADQFINKMQNGINTQAGPNGSFFSRGQRQKICLARALATDFDVLLLDEATSAMSSIDENKILGAINAEFQDKIIIVIAHRLTSLMWTDKLLLVEDGTITDIGSPAEIFESDSSYLRNLIAADQLDK